MGREKLSMDKGWKFHYGEIEAVRSKWAWAKSGSWNLGPQSRRFDDSTWQDVELPHDFVIATEPKAYAEQESREEYEVVALEKINNYLYTTDSSYMEKLNDYLYMMAGSFQKNVGWYRKHFFIPKEDEGKKLYLVFEGIYRDSIAWLNDFSIGSERSGYKQIVYDITDVVNYGGDNLLSVKADARQAEGWFYEGGGIYRHAYVLKTEQAHIDNVFVHSDVNLEEKCAAVCVETSLDLEWEICPGTEVLIALYDSEGKEIARKDESVTKDKVTSVFNIEQPQLWDTVNPILYKAAVTLIVDGNAEDTITTDFGIRDIRFDAEKGFLLNGVSTKIKGACCHQNHGGLGTALPDEIYRFRIRKLKEMGANSYRTAHYPPSPALLDICDQEGMLVMEETRLLSSEKGDLEQLDTMVKRDRNHPSVILYSIGNEEAQSQLMKQGARIAGTIIRHIKKLDPYTPITMALLMSDMKERVPLPDINMLAGIADQLDVAGFNYWHRFWPEHHKRNPELPMVCTELGAFRSTRGCYETDVKRGHLAITDETFSEYMRGVEQWQSCQVDWMSGLHIWTGFDYYGEPKPYGWPAISSQPGAMDLCGYPKDSYYYYQSWWSDKDVLHIFPHWNLSEGAVKDIYVFSNCDEVELFINDISIGRKPMPKDGYLIWKQVAYEPGVLTGIGYRHTDAMEGEIMVEVMRQTIKTVGAAWAVRLSEDYRENAICVVKAEIVDEDGNVVPDGNDEIIFTVKGGRVMGTSNGDPSDHTAPNGSVRKAFHGLAQVIIQLDCDKAEDGIGFKTGKVEICALTNTVKGSSLVLS